MSIKPASTHITYDSTWLVPNVVGMWPTFYYKMYHLSSLSSGLFAYSQELKLGYVRRNKKFKQVSQWKIFDAEQVEFLK